MKRMIVTTSLVLLVIVAWAICISGQEQTKKDQDAEGRGTSPYVVGSGVKIPANGAVLLQAIIRKDGTVDGFEVLPTPSSAGPNGKLKIEMQDGSIQEIDLKKVKKITIEP